MLRLLRFGLPVIALAAACVSLALLVATQSAGAARLLARGCGVVDGFDCSGVLASDWAQLGPLPTSAWGAAYFLFLALWYAIAGLPNRSGRRWHLLPIGLTTAGLALSLLLISIMARQLGAWCLWCLLTHAFNAMLFIGALLAWPRRATARPVDALPEPPRPGSARVAVVFALAVSWTVALVGLFSAAYYNTMASSSRGAYLQATNRIDYLVWRHASSAACEIPIRDDDPAAGSANAPHTLVAFLDFQCDHCREWERFAPGLLRRYPGKLRYVLKHYPMNAACSAELPARHDRHPAACDAARAFEAARACGTDEQARRFRAALSRVGAPIGRRPWREWAAELGIDTGCLIERMGDLRIHERIAADVALARKLDIDGSGAVFLDGRPLASWRIVTRDMPPRTDDLETWRLWDALLSEPEASPPAGR